MPALKWNLAKLYVALEAAFLTDPDATGAQYKLLKVTDLTFQPQAEVIERPGQTGDMTRQPHVIGAKGGTLSWKMELKGSGTPAGDALPSIAAESSPVLESCLGTVVRGEGTTVAAASGDGSGASPVKVVDASGLQTGMLVEIAGEHRFVTGVTGGTDVALDRPLSAAPALSTVVYASSLFSRANSGHKSLSLVAFRDSVEFTFSGCFVTVKLSGLNARGTPTLECSATVGTWARTTKAALPPAELAGVGAVKAPVVKGSPFAVGGVEELVSGMEFDPGQGFAFQESTAGIDNKSGVELVQAQPAGNFKPYYAASHLDDFVAGTERALAFACGDKANGFGLYIPKAQYTQPSLEDRGGMVGESVPFAVNDAGTGPEYFLSVF